MAAEHDPVATRTERLKLVAGFWNALAVRLICFAVLKTVIEGGRYTITRLV